MERTTSECTRIGFLSAKVRLETRNRSRCAQTSHPEQQLCSGLLLLARADTETDARSLWSASQQQTGHTSRQSLGFVAHFRTRVHDTVSVVRRRSSVASSFTHTRTHTSTHTFLQTKAQWRHFIGLGRAGRRQFKVSPTRKLRHPVLKTPGVEQRLRAASEPVSQGGSSDPAQTSSY